MSFQTKKLKKSLRPSLYHKFKEQKPAKKPNNKRNSLTKKNHTQFDVNTMNQEYNQHSFKELGEEMDEEQEEDHDLSDKANEADKSDMDWNETHSYDKEEKDMKSNLYLKKLNALNSSVLKSPPNLDTYFSDPELIDSDTSDLNEDEDEDDDSNEVQQHENDSKTISKSLTDIVESAFQSATSKKKALKAQQPQQRTEAYQENEFFVPPSNLSKLNLTQLVSTLNDEVEFGLLKKQLIHLKKDKKETQKLQLPLPDRLRAKIQRETYYQDTKEQVSQWTPIIEHIKHTPSVTFPLPFASQKQLPPNPSLNQLAVAATKLDKTASPLEEALAKLTLPTPTSSSSSSLSSATDSSSNSTHQASSELSLLEPMDVDLTNDLSKETAAAKKRVQELRYLRELALRQDLKAKRAAKIKSKTYRKILKREKMYEKKRKLQHLLDSNPDHGETIQLQAEIERAQNRVSMKKKHTWAQCAALLTSPNNDEINSATSWSTKEMQQEKETLEKEEQELQAKLAEASSQAPKKGLFAMKFMIRAQEQLQHQEEQSALEEVKEEFTNDQTTFSSFATTTSSTNATFFAAPVVAGRRRVGGAFSSTSTPAAPVPLVTSSTPTSHSSTSKTFRFEPTKAKTSFASSFFAPKTTPSTHSSTFSNPPSTNHSSSIELKGNISDNDDEAEDDNDEKDEPVRSASLLASNETSWIASQTSRKPSTDATTSTPSMLSLDVPELPLSSSSLLSKESGDAPENNHPLTFSKQEIAEIFEGDNVVEDFQAAKEATMMADAPKEIDVTLPGWGSWSGADLNSKPKRQVIKKIAGIDPKHRTDRHLSHVILHQKIPKPLLKYMTPHLPHPFTHPDHYLQSLRPTLGKEWVTAQTLVSSTLPKFQVNPGMVVTPLTLKKKEAERLLEQQQKLQEQQLQELKAKGKTNEQQNSNALKSSSKLKKTSFSFSKTKSTQKRPFQPNKKIGDTQGSQRKKIFSIKKIGGQTGKGLASTFGPKLNSSAKRSRRF